MTFPPDLQLKPWDPSRHAPILGLINPASGPKKGQPILDVAHRTDYFKDRIFNIIEVFKGSFKKGEQFVKFREMLNEAKAKAIEKNDPKFRPRLLIGGGDGTASFAVTVLFKVWHPDPENGFPDTGNRFTWTDEELEKYFPALIQMPLGTGNDLGRAMGWGHHYPGWTHCIGCCAKAQRGKNLVNWIDSTIDVSTPVIPFDVWGFMPPPGQDSMNVKVCELAKVKKVDGKKQFIVKPADPVAPFLVFLYASYGFMAQVISRFAPNRREGQLANKAVMTRSTSEIILGFRAKQLRSGMDGLTMYNLPGANQEKNGTDRYFPPRDRRKASVYKDVGFMNVNSIVGGNLHGKDRKGCMNRWILCGHDRKPVTPCDGKADFFRQRLLPTLIKTGSRLLTDKKEGCIVKFKGEQGQGQFVQFDGEGRFAFHPDGEEWRMDIKNVLKVPMVCSKNVFKRFAGGKYGVSEDVNFSFSGTDEEKAAIKARLIKWVDGGLVSELNATPEEIKRAGMPLFGEVGSADAKASS